MAGEVVRLHNVGSQDFRGKYDGVRYVIQAGGQAIVPVEAMQHWLGRPHAIDRGRWRERTDEFNRLKQLYGSAFVDPEVDGPIDEEAKWARNKPFLEAYDLDGTRIITVVDDPKGEHLNPADVTQAEQRVVLDQMEALKRQLSQLQSEYAAQQAGQMTDLDDVPIDEPKTVPVGAKRGREQ
jgi:hypothetical protein